VKLILYDREGDILRQVTAAVAEDGRSILTSFESIRGAYRAAVRMPDRRVLAIDAAELADPEGDRAVLSLAASMPGANSTAVPLGALAEAAYEETALEQRYLAEKRGKAERWEEAITHWKRALEMDPSLRPAVEAALEEAYLKAHAAALAEGREQDAQLRLQEAIELLPDRGPLRLRFAESYAAREEYREAIEQYLLASELLSSQAEDTTPAIVRTYRQWGQALLRQGQFTAAANMFREALQWDGANGELYFAWGKAEFHQRALRAAIQAFEAAQIYDPSLRSEVEPYLLKAQALLEGPRAAVIDFPPGATRIEVPVVLNGRLEVPFILDTGASVTLVPAWAADVLGYGAQGTGRWVEVQTAGGPRRLPYATVSRLEIQGLSVSNLSVVFGDLPGDHRLKGLLGMDVLRQFSIAVDHEIGRMTLRLK
jgi:tetratricopeptide (TPR) repeat protein